MRWRPTCSPSPSVMAPPDVLVLGGRPEGWHGARLREAMRGLGLTVARAQFQDLGFSLDGGRPCLTGIAALPRVVLVRSIPAGSFEQVTLRLGLLHALQALGVAVVNDARAIERCVDKAMTSFLLAVRGLPTPPTWATQSPATARARCAEEAQAGPSAGAQAPVRRAGPGLAAAGRPRRAAGVRSGGRRLLPATLRPGRRRRLVRPAGVRGRWPGDSCHAPAQHLLDHQYRPRRQGRAGPRHRRAGKARRRRGRRRGRGPCRRRPDRGPGGPPADPRGQQHAGMARPPGCDQRGHRHAALPEHLARRIRRRDR